MRYGTLVKLFRRAAAGAANAVRSAGREKGASPVAIAQGRPRVGFVPVGRSLPQICGQPPRSSSRSGSIRCGRPVHLAIGREVPAAMTGLAAVTERPAVGTAVLLAPLYHPVIVAKQAAELDVLTEGRVALGLGSGKSTRWSSVPAGCLAEYALVVMTAAAALLHEGAIRHSVTATLAGADPAWIARRGAWDPVSGRRRRSGGRCGWSSATCSGPCRTRSTSARSPPPAGPCGSTRREAPATCDRARQEHQRFFTASGWSKANIRQALWDELSRLVRESDGVVLRLGRPEGILPLQPGGRANRPSRSCRRTLAWP